ncbi:hypothetical protein BC477_00935 [Clavibacter michiganensis subsp. michiganensis]|uniref:N-acetyltransferase domain-containing protein n=1 Tax=Clavibacter michiganensis subsp. michiganensis TaxID=33013 RepID=A0A251XEL4_CLAMM|nr:hypothetical protein BC477_00935 [Clavibacter michiganensis subsp. michiganensis]OUE00859.1 hypothetical protein CMMCAS07_15585 [Clavibacter michiganensis subsp. michiganensis]
MTATVPAPAPLIGTHVRLDPLTPDHLPALRAAIAHPAVFAGGFGGGSAGLRTDPAEFDAWARGYFRWDDLPCAVILVGGPHDGELVGTTSLTELDTRRERAHLGWTAYDPRVWGTVVNAEAKRLLLGLAFDAGFGRVKLQADARNAHSRAAILKLGATFEGVCRRDQLRADGTWRDAAIHSILADEWPAVRAGLDARIAAQEGDRSCSAPPRPEATGDERGDAGGSVGVRIHVAGVDGVVELHADGVDAAGPHHVAADAVQRGSRGVDDVREAELRDPVLDDLPSRRARVGVGAADEVHEVRVAELPRQRAESTLLALGVPGDRDHELDVLASHRAAAERDGGLRGHGRLLDRRTSAGGHVRELIRCPTEQAEG